MTFFNNNEIDESMPMIDNKSYDINIFNIQGELRKCDYQLPTKFNIKEIDLYIGKNLNLVHNFLQKNYITSNDGKTSLSYSKTVLIWLLRQTTINMCLGLFYCDSLIGFISAIPITVILNQEEHNTYQINLFCIHHRMRKKGMGRYLLMEIKNRILASGGKNAIFTSSKEIGKFSSRSCLAGILLQTDNPDLLKYVPNASELTGMRHLSRDDVKEVNKRLQTHMKKFKVYPKFTDEQFLEHFRSVRDGIYSYVLWKGREPAGFISFISVDYHTDDTIKKMAYIYYYYGDIDELLLASISHLKKRDIRELRFYLLMDNHQINIPSIIMKHCLTHYYFYNFDEQMISSEDMGLLFI